MLVRLIFAFSLFISSTSTSEVTSFQTPNTLHSHTTPTTIATETTRATCLHSEPTSTATSETTSSTCPATATTAAMTAAKLRAVQKVLPRPPPHWVGDGFHVYPVFGNLAFTKEISPLLMFDYGAPKTFAPKPFGTPRGVGQHPHRGFETVTIAFQGEAEHKDSAGNSGVIRAGDVQWMTAGRGIVHEERHSKKLSAEGGTLEMCQLWVNLPKKDKMTKPGYQAIVNDEIPVVDLPLGSSSANVQATARVIAGEVGATKGAASTYSPVQVWDVSLPHAGSEIDLPFPAAHNCLLFVRRGSVQIVGPTGDDTKTLLKPQEVAIMEMNGTSDTIRVRVIDPDSSLLVLGGEPINEPIAARGPFVMNTQDELMQAMMDYQSGAFGA